ncbi:hypothetical protein RPMA_07105 [Tardiphaga alba]|uniref:Uncharacterized protein n=2 Tax=Tardiphaga alba TaxID=340268 RepID=A0ABX8A844_9BRAD|nr:hypothetical protein RPMA_07105 [Tardiphaga alba]
MRQKNPSPLSGKASVQKKPLVSAARSSQVANFRLIHNAPLKLPEDIALSAPGAITRKLREATKTRLAAQHQDRRSHHRELALVYHVGHFLLRNKASWELFVAEHSLQQADFTARAVLRAALNLYAGAGKAAQKTASRYHRALIVPFEKRLAVEDLFHALNNGGVDGLLKTAKRDNPQNSRQTKRLPLLNIDGEHEFSVVLDKNTIQPLVIRAAGSGRWQYEVVVTKRLLP